MQCSEAPMNNFLLVNGNICFIYRSYVPIHIIFKMLNIIMYIIPMVICTYIKT